MGSGLSLSADNHLAFAVGIALTLDEGPLHRAALRPYIDGAPYGRRGMSACWSRRCPA
jgi:hypothetical protein